MKNLEGEVVHEVEIGKVLQGGHRMIVDLLEGTVVKGNVMSGMVRAEISWNEILKEKP